ncbi:MAG: DUF4266 domain-containing protein [Deltaproteobacteria bacterium]|nr:DUF4266 domain-containing protein [Sandaracinaceae bacterium]MCX7807872.1 DUF4266 domain-containing protein [Deltaproteobacteria bacterium]MDW8245187.1 DUF4266 domain-containing protein [Sandaracinaceae bacterium]
MDLSLDAQRRYAAFAMSRFFQLLLLFVLFTSACVSVPPYRRGTLSRPAMNTEHEQHESRFRAHVHDAREGATGGHGSTGGGCGCN